MCHGAPYINPVLETGVDLIEEYKKRDLKDPTNFEWIHKRRSQHRYLERFGPPYVYNVDMDNMTQLEEALEAIKKNPIEPLVPKEFRKVEFLRRFYTNIKQHLSNAKKRAL